MRSRAAGSVPGSAAVIEVEYTDNGGAAFAAACRERGDRIPVLLRDADVVPRGNAAYRAQWCVAQN